MLIYLQKSCSPAPAEQKVSSSARCGGGEGAASNLMISDFATRCYGTLLVGSSQSERPTREMSSRIGRDIRNPNMGVTIFDGGHSLLSAVKEQAEQAHRKLTIFDPTLLTCPCFNPLAGDERDVIQTLLSVYRSQSRCLPPDIQVLEEQLLVYAVKVLKRLDKEMKVDGDYSTLIRMACLLQNNYNQGRDLVTRFYNIRSAADGEAKENMNITNWFLNQYFAEHSCLYEKAFVLRAKVSMCATNPYLQYILNPDPEKAEHNQIDFGKHLADGGVLYVTLDRTKLNEIEADFLSSLLVDKMQDAILHRKEGSVKPHALYLHEGQYFLHRSFVEVAQRMKAKKVAVTASIPCRPIAEYYLGKQFANMLPELLQNVVLCDQTSDNDPTSPPVSPHDGVYDVLEQLLTSKSGNFDFLYDGI